MLEGIKSKITKAEEWLSDKEDRIIEIITMEKSKEKRMKRNENSCRNLWDNHRHSNTHIIGALEGEEREKGPGEISEEMTAENSPEMRRKTFKPRKLRVPHNINTRRDMLRQILNKVTEIKGKEKY